MRLHDVRPVDFFFALAFAVALVRPPLVAQAESPPAPAFERTEQREACSDQDPLRRPMFGDLHVHTSLSFDSYISSQRNDPAAAYRYAKGEEIVLPDAFGAQTVKARIQRPLDFAAVTDHSDRSRSARGIPGGSAIGGPIA
jgi:hypothetical protein